MAIEDENDLSALTLQSSTFRRVPLTTTVSQPEQVIKRESVELGKHTKKEIQSGNAGIENIILHWPNSDIWPFKIGIPILGLACGVSGFFVNYSVRNALYLEHYARLSSYVGTVFFPSLATGLFHGQFVSTKILQEQYKCPVCLQVTSAVIQLIFGIGYPLMTSPIINYNTATQLKGVYLPKIHKNPRDLWTYTKEVYRPIKGSMGIFAAVHIILAMGVTYFEQECYFTKILPILEGKETFLKSASIKVESS